MESLALLVLVAVVVAIVVIARRRGLLQGTPEELRAADRAQDAARAAPHHAGDFGG